MAVYEEIFKGFQKANVKYVLVGGMAVNLFGALRATADVDIIVALEAENLKAIISVLKKRGYRLKQPVDILSLADKRRREDLIKNKHLKALNFYKQGSVEEIDIIVDTPVSYQKAATNSSNVKCGLTKVPLISMADLIKMKKYSNRQIDKTDIDLLNTIKRFREKR